MSTPKKDSPLNAGFAPFLLLIVLAIGVLVIIVFKNSNLENITSVENTTSSEKVKWHHENGEWRVTGTPPSCPEPFLFSSPADVALASGILYPGQIRGNDYKPHGGIRFDDLANNDVDVYAPFDGNLYKAARHIEQGEIQYALYFINDCGIMYKLDHLRQLTAKFEKILDTIPQGGEGDSRTTEIPSEFVKKGEHVATKVGFEVGKNVFLDFGVYDLRNTNGIAGNDEYKSYGICWFDYLMEPDKSTVRALPGADSVSGANSDYCK